MENTKCHEVERFENLMYKGCESHWHCIHCDDYWPFHCYGKKDLEQMECPARKDKKTKDSLKKLGDDYGLTPEGVRHAIEVYQDIICEITGGLLSKLTYDADIILEKAEEHYERKYGKSGEIGMSGAELIKWIQDHNAEDYQIVIYRDGYTDSLGCGLDDPDDNEKIIYI